MYKVKGGRRRIESPAAIGIAGWSKTSAHPNYAILQILADLAYLFFGKSRKIRQFQNKAVFDIFFTVSAGSHA
jgi:hypothetical protein